METHDCFTIAELIEYEAMGLTAAGQGLPRVREGMAEKVDELPVNPSGGSQDQRATQSGQPASRCTSWPACNS